MLSETKYKAKYGIGRPLDLRRVAKVSDRTELKMFQRFAILPAQVKADNTSKNLLNEIRQIKYSLYRAKEILLKKHITI